MRQWLVRYGDGFFVVGVIFAFVGVGYYALEQRYMNMHGWETDFSQRTVKLGEIITGNMPRHMMQAVNHPDYAPIEAVDWLHSASPVIVLSLAGDSVSARAYPLALLLVHGIVNDVIADTPFAVTYCPLCNSPIVYGRTIENEVLTFAPTGHLRRSGFIMYDEQTQSWWQQFTGEAIVGVYAGERLPILTSMLVSYEAFTQQYPDGLVLMGDAQQPQMRYQQTRFVGYDSAMPAFYRDEIDPRLPPMERVLTALIDEQAVAYPFSHLAQVGVVNDVVEDVALVAFWQEGALSVLDDAVIDRSRDVGMATLFDRRLPDGRVLSFERREGRFIDRETGSVWNIFGEAVSGALEGAQLTQRDCFPHFWFAWVATYPQTLIYGQVSP